MQLTKNAVGIVAALSVCALFGARVEAGGNIHEVPGEFPTIQAAIVAAAFSGDEVHVAPGFYAEVINFLGKDVRVFGTGGAAVTTIGDIGGPLVTATSEEGPGTILEGFSLAFSSTQFQGSAAYVAFSSPTFIDCVFEDNLAGERGGAVYLDGSNSTFTRCSFLNNVADSRGGAIEVDSTSDPVFDECTFTGNRCNGDGGAIGCASSSASITASKCTFSGNMSRDDGGGVYSRSPVTFTDCTFDGNETSFFPDPGGSGAGGAMFLSRDGSIVNCLFIFNSSYNDGGAVRLACCGSFVITNCTFAFNSTSTGSAGAIADSASGKGSVDIANTICWFDSPGEITASGPNVTYSNIEGGFAGTGNIDTDPLFVGSAQGTGFQLRNTSPCIDAADNTAVPGGVTTDLDGNPRFVDVPGVPDTGNGTAPIVDMGAYESQGPQIRLVPEEYPTIQAAIDASVDGDEVHVSAGIYPEVIDLLGKAIRVFGNFGAATIDGSGIFDSVVTCTSGETAATIIEGFNIINGEGSPGKQTVGAGLNFQSASPTVKGCRIIDCDGADEGGGAFLVNSDSIFEQVLFRHNDVTGNGGGIAILGNSNPAFTFCNFDFNTAGGLGGGVYIGSFDSSATVTACLFSLNDAAGPGGAMYNFGPVTVTTSTFQDNTANIFGDHAGVSGGAAMYNEQDSTIANSLFVRNIGAWGGAIVARKGLTTVINSTFTENESLQPGTGGAIHEVEGAATIKNSILWGDLPQELDGGPFFVNNSNIQGGGFVGDGNIDLNPLFQSESPFRVGPGSPCIDAGNNADVPIEVTIDIDGNPRFIDQPDTPDCQWGGTCGTAPIVDMGSGEFQLGEGGDITFEPPLEEPAEGEANLHVVGDFNNDTLVDVVAVLPQQIFEPSGRYQVFLNNGNADGQTWQGLSGQTPDNTGQGPSGIAEGQFNTITDTHLDMVISNFTDDNVSVFLGNGDGTFDLLNNIDVGDGPSDVVTADFTDDGLIDFAVCHEGDNMVWIFEGNGDGTFDFLTQQGTGGQGPNRMGGVFIDDDKCIDIGGVNNNSSDGGPGGNVFILLNTGGGFFDPPDTYSVGADPSDLSFGDLNGDTFADVVTSNEGDNTVSVLLNQTDGTLVAEPPLSVGSMPLSVDLTDLDNDSDDDLSVVADDPGIGPAVQVFENFFDGNALTFSLPDPRSVDADPNFVTHGDFDADARQDLVTVNTDDGPTGGSVTVLLNESTFFVNPGSFLYQGTLLGGDLASLASSDDNYLTIQQLPAIAPILPVLILEVTGVAESETASELLVRVETASNAVPNGPLQNFSLFSYELDAFELVDSRHATTSDQVIEVRIVDDASSFIEPGSLDMMMRLEYFDPLNVIFVAWNVRFDQAAWAVTVQE